jgi:methylenetetrahydrofolate dehydrogenase (NADP+)/methenyltetrahydrofolate cyclohydrolase
LAAEILNGKALAKELRVEIGRDVTAFVESTSVTPKLVAVLVGEDPASQVYVRNKERACEKAGIAGEVMRLAAETTEADLLALIDRLNSDVSVHGILVQLPLPDSISEQKVLDAIHPLKDVDAFHPENVGLMMQGRPRFLPCTPHGVLQILKRYDIKAAGKHVVIVGRSEIVGKPLAAMLVQRNSDLGKDVVNATVTICHSRTEDLPSVTRQADILIAAVGIPRFITTEMVKPGAVIIDVGINRLDDGLVGDVDFDPLSETVSHITPVPGGVGPLTIAMLLRNTLKAAELQSTDGGR